MRKRIACLLTIVILIVSLTACGAEQAVSNSSIEASVIEAGTFKTAVLDIGKADAIILQTENHVVLIDAGKEKNGAEVLEYLQNEKIAKLDYLIITHFDKDHVGGADRVLRNIPVENIIQPYYTRDSKQYKQYIAILEEVEITPLPLTETLTFTLDDVEFTVYPSGRTDYGEDDPDNEWSLVVSARHEENSFLFAGDAIGERLQELLAMETLEHTFLKVPHHGKYDKSSGRFLEAVSPQYAVITCSKSSSPSGKVLKKLKELGTEVYLTQEGNVICVSDGSSIEVRQ